MTDICTYLLCASSKKKHLTWQNSTPEFGARRSVVGSALVPAEDVHIDKQIRMNPEESTRHKKIQAQDTKNVLFASTLPETSSKSPEKWMVGIRSFPGFSTYFQVRTVSFREGIYKNSCESDFGPDFCFFPLEIASRTLRLPHWQMSSLRFGYGMASMARGFQAFLHHWNFYANTTSSNFCCFCVELPSRSNGSGWIQSSLADGRFFWMTVLQHRSRWFESSNFALCRCVRTNVWLVQIRH